MSTIPSRLSRSFSQISQHGSPVDDAQSNSSQTMKGFHTFRDEVKKHLPFAADLSNIESIVDGIFHLNSLDDRKMLLEHTLVFLSNNAGSPKAKKIETLVIKLLYNDLPHPADTYVGSKHAFREADGSCNNVCMPDLGKARSPYVRNVQQVHPLPSYDLPDPGLVFDTLLRRDKFVPHPAGLSSLMFAFAATVIHTVFRTSHHDPSINETSSYVDLAPLYGNNQETQKKIRVIDGRGLLKPDTFAEDRLLLLPPAVCVILVLFNRNHNFIARKLLELNERGTYIDPDSVPNRTDAVLKQDEDIFQTARLVNCGWFGSAVFADYVAAILGLVRQGSSWSLNPFEEVRNLDHSLFERGRGNACSVEFNCLYRWHATTSECDEKWVENLSKKLFKDRAVESVTVEDFKCVAQQMKPADLDMSHWTFNELQRDAVTGAFDDKELADILKNATEHPAGAFKARGTPHVMRLHEIMGIEANRTWGVCSLNDFRKYLGLKTYSSFLEWNSNPEIASAAEKLYGHIDRLELYVGLQAEEAKPVIDGAGLCPSYTISRAILSDAVSLTRGDRFFTSDYTPFNLTAWGFSDCQRDADGPGNGSMLGRLFLRTLPGEFTNNSTYAWFPLMTPDAMQRILTKLGSAEVYDLKRPTTVPEVPVLSAFDDVKAVLHDETSFGTGFLERVEGLVQGPGFFMASDNPARAAREAREMLDVTLETPADEDRIKHLFFEKTRELIARGSCRSVGTSVYTVDIVNNVLKVVPIYWACEMIGIRLKESADDEGDYTPLELSDVIAQIYTFLFLDVEPEKVPKLKKNVTANVEKLLGVIRRQLGGSRFSISGLVQTMSQLISGSSKKGVLGERLRRLGHDMDTQCNMILAFLVGSTVELSQAMANVINFYLGPFKPANQALASKFKGDGTVDLKDEALLQGYVLEALRLDPTSRGVYREVLKTVNLSQGPLKTGQRVFVDVSTANTSGRAFIEPNDVNPARGFDKYLVIDGGARCIGLNLSSKIVANVVRAVYSFKGVTRAPGTSGRLKRYKDSSVRTSSWVYLGYDQQLSPWATSMLVQYSL